MAKVSVGLRGWRFEESEIFTEDGEFKSLDDIPEDPRKRLIRLTYLVDEPCDACYLTHGEAEKRQCRQAEIVYGEAGDELLLCGEHEADFLYWFREAGGRDFAGEEAFRDEFHLWFDDGGRAPEGYGGVDHVETDPENLPTPPDITELHRRLNENFDGKRVTFTPHEDAEIGVGDEDSEPASEEEMDALDFETDYPSK